MFTYEKKNSELLNIRFLTDIAPLIKEYFLEEGKLQIKNILVYIRKILITQISLQRFHY